MLSLVQAAQAASDTLAIKERSLGLITHDEAQAKLIEEDGHQYRIFEIKES